MDKHAMRIPFANSHYQSDEDDDDDRSCDFDFHPYRSLQPSSSSPLMNQIDFGKSIHGKSSTLYDGVLSSEIELKIKELSNNLLHGIEGIITRLSQLESRTQQIENDVDDLKYSTGYNHGRTEGKLRNLENILLEVKDGIHFLRDKQEIAITKLQLAKLAAASSNSSTSQSKDRNYPPQIDQVRQAPPYALQQPHPPLPPPVTFPLTPPSAYQNFPQVNSTVPAQLPSPFHSEIPAQQNQYSHPPPHQDYPPSSEIDQVRQAPPYTLQQPHPPLPPPVTFHLTPPSAYQNFPQVDSTAPAQLPSPFYSEIPAQQNQYSHPPPHQDYPPSPQHFQSISQSSFSAVTPQNFHPNPKETSPYFPTYNHPPGVPPQSFPYPSGSHPFSRSPKSDEYTNYIQLPKAQILPRALPTALSVNDADETRNRVVVPIDDDVVEKVVSMGFRRDLVRATARKLAENGQSVDLNVVLDKLMNSKGM